MDYKLTRKSQEALSAAIRRATADGNPQVEPVHLLSALIGQAEGVVRPLLKEVGADPGRLSTKVEEEIARLPRASGSTVNAPASSRQLIISLNTAAQRAKQMEDEYVSTEHLLVGLAADGGTAATLLREAGATPEALLDAFSRVRGSARVTRRPRKTPTRRSRSTGWTSPSGPAKANWTRLSAETRRSAG